MADEVRLITRAARQTGRAVRQTGRYMTAYSITASASVVFGVLIGQPLKCLFSSKTLMR